MRTIGAGSSALTTSLRPSRVLSPEMRRASLRSRVDLLPYHGGIPVRKPQQQSRQERKRGGGGHAGKSGQVGEHKGPCECDEGRRRYGHLCALGVEAGERLAPEHVERASAKAGQKAACEKHGNIVAAQGG